MPQRRKRSPAKRKPKAKPAPAKPALAKPVLLLFHAEWCPHCRRFMPDFDAFARKMARRTGARTVKVESAELPAMREAGGLLGGMARGVSMYPTTYLVTPRGGAKQLTQDQVRAISARL